jgi:hypothetical protein
MEKIGAKDQSGVYQCDVTELVLALQSTGQTPGNF